MRDITLGYAFCGSFCTMAESLAELEKLSQNDIRIIPIMSEAAYGTDTRFGKAESINERIEELCHEKIIHTITAAEPIGPKKLLDILVVSPCTGNTAAKIALGITDTPVTMAVKAHLRNGRPVVLGLATNDALGASAKNIGVLHGTKNIYFIPYGQDDPESKPTSMVCDFKKTGETIEAALAGRQIQPILDVRY
ncbi:MAG: dipicolinate synthase subunit B [Clostridia bacterium]|nr:dipicolinate synthase subunit B [Clostridia bacterium]